MVEMLWEARGRLHRVLRDNDEPARLKIVALKWNVVKVNGALVATGRTKEGVRKLLHRWMVDAKDDEVVTPKDGNYLNVQRSNLEIQKRSQKAFDTYCGANPNGYRGVSFILSSGKYKAQIKGCSIGHFKTAEEAARAYDEHALKIYGRRVNFPAEG